ncbi:DeoR family transcriptional regulator [Lentibacillus kapialis]|uniref:DeoR family transcriptional regulator n=1 Tax=Lentibacillus kapialis TaxID=340214 RepID=A0A917PY59_9BACI|nr:transcriptional regulator GutM [Lentibacillus kapialis]GGJ98985.1 DeoR family transcriptional regulator [Lentibacillus kapialis]
MEILLIMAGIMVAWVLQTLLGSTQIKNFNKHYNALRSQGKVSIGRSKGIFRSGVVLLMSLDNKRRIRTAKKMQGVTILARFKDYSILEGQDLLHIDEAVYNKMDRFTQKAFDEAVEVYTKVSKGEEIPPSKSPFGKLVSNFSKS